MAQTEQRLAETHEALPEVRAQGYRVEPAQQAIGIGQDRLRDSALALAQGNAAHVEEALAAAELAALRAQRLGPQIATLRADNERRLGELGQALAALDAQRAETRQRFDLVQAYNPSTWSDIRGNGSEAEAAMAQARQLLASAGSRNSAEAQDFGGAETELSSAEQRMIYARTLFQAIDDRLKNLQEAERLAQAEIADAASDLDKGWAFVRSNDPDVGKVPEELLERAALLLEQARQEIATAQPNWILALQTAQEANRTADEALAGARSEFELMEKRRQEVQRAEALAVAEGQKLGNFVQLHRPDIDPAERQRMQALLASINAAVTLAQSAGARQEHERATALDQALEQFTRATQQAQEIYSRVYGAFQAREGLRQETATAVQTAEQSLNNASAWYNQYGGLLPAGSEGWQLLEQAKRTLRPFDPQANAETLEAIRVAAQQSNDLSHRAAEIIRQATQSYQANQQHQQRQGSDLGVVLTGVLIGSMLDNVFGGRRRYGGWGGGWGGGWSGGGGDGGGHSSGGWGGGGGDGGGFSSGDWGGGGGDGGGGDGGDWGGGGDGGFSSGDW